MGIYGITLFTARERRRPRVLGHRPTSQSRATSTWLQPDSRPQYRFASLDNIITTTREFDTKRIRFVLWVQSLP